MSKTSQLGSVTSSDLIDAKLEEHQFCASKHCPGCGHKLDGKPDWVGLPAGVKFDPTDQELIEHLEAKVEGKESESESKSKSKPQSHPLIDEFIPTIEGEDGICYTHPEKLPGVTRDGLSRHFFHRPSKAYTTGTRKRRKIQTECDVQSPSSAAAAGETRWHKTGKTRPVMVNAKQKGCKKILVLYTNFGKNRKPEKTNWVMHQYHLGQNEEEKEGELVVSKIFYQTQPRQCNWSERSAAAAGGADDQFKRETAASGSANCNTASSMEIMNQSEDFSTVVAAAAAAAAAAATAAAPVIQNYAGIDHLQQLKADQFRFLPYKKTFDEAIGEGGGACEEREMGQRHMTHCGVGGHQHHQIAAAAAYHISRPSHSISTIISPPPQAVPLHHSSIGILDQESSTAYHVPRIMLPAAAGDGFQGQQHHKIGGRSASGLEELIMGCTTSSADMKEDSSMANPQEAEWLKYSPFWPDPDNPDHHHHHNG